MSAYNNNYTVNLPLRKHSITVLVRLLQAMAMLLLLGSASLAGAQKLVDISSCTNIADDKQRFACYDNLARAAGALPPATAPAAPAKPATAPVATNTDSTRIAAFGNSSQARLEAAANGQEMLIDTVTAVKDYKQDLVQVTLSSGQTWRQMVAQRFLLRAGDKVHIVPNPWGDSYRLSADGRSGFIQVEKLANKK